MEIKQGRFIVKATTGDTNFGGQDIDNVLVEYFLDEIKRENDKDLRKNKKAIGKIKEAAKFTKEQLSTDN